MPERGPINQYEILDYAVRKNHINTGAVITAKIPDKDITTPKLDDYAVEEPKIATGEVSHKKLDEDHGTETAVPDTTHEIAHDLGKEPTKVTITEKDSGVLDHVYLNDRTASSIIVKAGTSGVDIRWHVM